MKLHEHSAFRFGHHGHGEAAPGCVSGMKTDIHRDKSPLQSGFKEIMKEYLIISACKGTVHPEVLIETGIGCKRTASYGHLNSGDIGPFGRFSPIKRFAGIELRRAIGRKPECKEITLGMRIEFLDNGAQGLGGVLLVVVGHEEYLSAGRVDSMIMVGARPFCVEFQYSEVIALGQGRGYFPFRLLPTDCVFHTLYAGGIRSHNSLQTGLPVGGYQYLQT